MGEDWNKKLRKEGMQIMAVRILRYGAEKPFFVLRADELAEWMDVPVSEVEMLVDWVSRFRIRNLIHEFLYDEMNEDWEKRSALCRALWLYGNMYIRDLFPKKSLNWKNVAQFVKKDTNYLLKSEYLQEKFEAFAKMKEELINECAKDFSRSVVEEIATFRVNFDNWFELGYLFAYLEVVSEHVKELMNNDGISQKKVVDIFNLNSDVEKVLFPDAAFSKEIQAFRDRLMDLDSLKKGEVHLRKEQIDILIGMALINKTSLGKVAKYMLDYD